MAPMIWLGALLLAGDTPAQTAKEVKAQGYLEWRQADLLIVDGQRVRPTPGAKFKGKGDVASIPLGFEVEAKGTRAPDGVLLAREIEAKPNNVAMWESEVLDATRAAEAEYRKAGQMFQTLGDGRMLKVGRLIEDGPDVDRVQRIVAALTPPYLVPNEFRVYAVENKEWNAAAMGNKSIYVHTGLLRALDDDELAVVLGHEMVHATHEHSRRQAKKQMWTNMGIAVAAGTAEQLGDGRQTALAAAGIALAASAFVNGYGRDLEDQADRVGLRYAYEGAFDITTAPGLWDRFARKYGQADKVSNFFFGDHSLSSQRARNLERELATNYRDGPKKGATRARAVSAATAAAPASTRKTEKVDLRPGMSPAEVKALLGRPQKEAVSGGRTLWTYPDLTVVFEGGRVREVRF